MKFQSEEANTDEHLKKYFQAYILEHNSIDNCDIKYLSMITDAQEETISTSNLLNFKISNVFLPEQLSEKLKKDIAKAKKSIYTNPDLYLEISDGKNQYYESLELKSTKKNNIPGSSIQQITPFEWVIFVKRHKFGVTVSTGYYINSITEKLPFPDRSPRPQIGFKTLSDWNKKYRKVVNDTLLIKNISNLNDEKLKLLKDWQDYLATEWLEIVKAKEIKQNEKWFNNTLRKFAVKLLEYSETISESERTNLIKKLNSLIK